MAQRFLAGVALATLVVLAGCSSNSDQLEVTGMVTLNDTPVGTGNDASIRFEPVSGPGKPADAIVDKGQYSVQLSPGSYKVTISWMKGTGKKARPEMKGPGSDAELTEQAIPAQFNTKTTLKVDVSADARVHDFKLTK